MRRGALTAGGCDVKSVSFFSNVGQAAGLPLAGRPAACTTAKCSHISSASRNTNTTIPQEIIGGITTFAAMAYIIVLNPAILAAAGYSSGQVRLATILVAVFGSLAHGPLRQPPHCGRAHMGENAFIAFSLAAIGIGWQLRLGAVFVAGVVFLIITLVRLRTWLASAISPSMKPASPWASDCSSRSSRPSQQRYRDYLPANGRTGKDRQPPRHAQFCSQSSGTSILLISALAAYAKYCVGRLLMGMALTAVAGYLVGVGEKPAAVVAVPFTGGTICRRIAFQLDIVGVLQLKLLAGAADARVDELS